jgi:hypothetical protein
MWLFIIIISIIFIEILFNFKDAKSRETLLEQPNVLFVLIIHYIANGFLLYGWLFDNTNILFFHIVCCIFIMIYWTFNKGFCHLTLYVNEKCDWNETHLKDLLYLSGIKSTTLWKEKKLHYVIISLLGMISLYKILKRHKLTIH